MGYVTLERCDFRVVNPEVYFGVGCSWATEEMTPVVVGISLSSSRKYSLLPPGAGIFSLDATIRWSTVMLMVAYHRYPEEEECPDFS